MKHKTACSKSWTDVNINFKTRTVGNCCVSFYHDMPENVTVDFFDNSEFVQERRRDTLNGLQHPDCNACWRDINNGIPTTKDWIGEQYDFDSAKPDVPQVNYIEMELDNTCDLSCLYCSSDHSSKIAQEENEVVPSKFTEEDLNVYIQWLTKTINNSSNPIDIAFLGGEPTASKAFYQMIERIASLENMRGKIQVTTNGNTKEFLFNKFIAAMDKSNSKWAIHLSNESFKQDSNLIRYGLDWQRFESNLRAYAQHPSVSYILFDVAINAVALPTFPKYVNWLYDVMSEYDKPFTILGGFVHWPEELDISILPESYKKYATQAIEIVEQRKLPNTVNQEKMLKFLTSIETRVGSDYQENYRTIIEDFLKMKQEFKKTDQLLQLLDVKEDHND
jgi:organic radical activating enzyme